MTILPKCMLLVGLAGVSSAVGVPLALKSSDKLEIKQGGAMKHLNLKRCSSENYEGFEKINYGEKTDQEVCWMIEDKGERGTLSGNVLVNFTDVIKETWADTNQSWKGPTFGRWMQQCLGSEMPSQWAILLNSDSDTHHLGECGVAELHQTKFVKKMKDPLSVGNTENWLLWMCEKDCWDSDVNSIGGNTEVLQKEKSDQWKQIQFYKKTKIS